LKEIIDQCDVLDVCTPPHTHYPIVQDIIEAGKHMIVEKPLVTDADEWEILKRAIQKSNIKFAVLHNMKFGLAVQKAKKLIDKGNIGKLIRINRYFLTHPDS